MACGGGCCGPSKGDGSNVRRDSDSSMQPTTQVQDEQQQLAQVSQTTEHPIATPPPELAVNEAQAPSDIGDQELGCCGASVVEDKCCTGNSDKAQGENKGCTATNEKLANGCCGTAPSEVSCQDGCCGASLKSDSSSCASEQDSCRAGCCSTGEEKQKPTVSVKVAACASTCCDANNSSSDCCDDTGTCSQNTDAVQATVQGDIEKGASSRTHIVLSVTGMTCTGCETKLRRTLATLPAVANLKTSLVLARAEFDILELPSTSAEDVIAHLHRTTEFKCEQISNRGASLDLICDGEAEALVNSEWPEGVLDVRRAGKQAIKLDFDAHVVGARDLLGTEWAKSLRLAPPNPDAGLAAGSKHVRDMGIMTLLSAVLTIPVLVMSWAPLPERKVAYGSASLALATLVQVVVAGPFYPKAIKALVFSRVIEMDLLIVLSTSAAYIFSVVSFGYLVAGRPLATGEFFETSTLLVTLIMVGRFVASLARQKAAESVSIRSLQAVTTILVQPDGAEVELDVRLLQFGDSFKVAPDGRIPTDGIVLSGCSEVDESMLTGESMPVGKNPGNTVIAGSINGSGMLTVRLTRLPGDNTITTIAGMVDEAKLSKPKIQDTADKVASYFVPCVVALTIITFVIWVAIGVAVRGQSGSRATIEAITYAITVLIVSCPCAIGLAVPMVIVVASGVAAGRGVIFKSSASMEVAYKTTDVVFDKTGTLTKGELAVMQEVYLGEDEESIKSLLLSMVSGIKHPLSIAVAAHLSSKNVQAAEVEGATALPGKGIQARHKGRVLRAGNSRWLETSSHPSVKPLLSAGLTAFCFTIDDSLVAILALQDTARPDASSALSTLQALGISVHLLSGDDDGAVRAVASQLQIPDRNVRSHCSPADKQAYVSNLLSCPSSRRKQQSVVMFVGDGTNDAVALAQATIGVHVSGGTDIAQSAADVVLVRPNVAGVLTVIKLSKKAMARVWFNFAWSFVYNTFAVLLAAGAFVRARIPPEYAGLGELVSVLPVIIAAVLLRWERV